MSSSLNSSLFNDFQENQDQNDIIKQENEQIEQTEVQQLFSSSMDQINTLDQQQDDRMKAILIIKDKLYIDNKSNQTLVLNELDHFEHFQQIKNEENYTELLQETLEHLSYEFIPKGKFLFHFGDIGEKFYFIAKGKVSIHVPRTSKELFKQEKSYQLRKYWGDIIDQDNITANEREQAKQNYQRARGKILKYLDMYHHESFYKKLINGHQSNQKIMKKYFHQQYKTFGLYKQVNELKEGQSFGEVATISRKLRTASVFAEEDLHLFFIRGKDYLTIFSNQLYKLNFILKNLEKQFENLNKKQILDLSYLFDPYEITLNLNQIIFKEGQERQYIYLIKSGSVSFKSNRGISLGIIGEGEFFGFENMRGNSSSVLNEKHSFSAICIANGTVVYALKTQLLEDEGQKPVLLEFSQKGYMKAEYYAKRAQHCQNIFEQTEQSNPFYSELQNYQDLGTPKNSLSQNSNSLSKAKNLRKLMNKIQIQKKFLKYIEENKDSHNNNQNNTNNNSSSKSPIKQSTEDRQNRGSQFSNFIQQQQNDQSPDSKIQSSISINDNIIASSFSLSNQNNNNNNNLMLQSIKLQSSSNNNNNPMHISNQVNENDIQIKGFLTVDQINSLSSNTQFRIQSEQVNHNHEIQQKQQQQQNNNNNNNNNNYNEGTFESQFQFISKQEFEQTKYNIIKEQEKLRAKKSQHFMPQDIIDMPFTKKFSQKYTSSSSLLTPNQSQSSNPKPQQSSFFSQFCSPQKSSMYSSQQFTKDNKDNEQPPQSQFLQSSTIFNPSSQPSFVIGQRKSQLNISPIKKRNSVDTIKFNNNNNNNNNNNLKNNLGSRGSLLITTLQVPQQQLQSLQVTRKLSSASTSQQKIIEEQMPQIQNNITPSLTQLSMTSIPQQSSSPLPLTQTQRISKFSYSTPNHPLLQNQISNFKIEPTIKNNNDNNDNSKQTQQDKININILDSSSIKPEQQNLQNQQIQKNVKNSSRLQSPHDLYHPELLSDRIWNNMRNSNYVIPQTFSYLSHDQTSDDIINNNSPLLQPNISQQSQQQQQQQQKSLLNISSSNFYEQPSLQNGPSIVMNETLKHFNQTNNKQFYPNNNQNNNKKNNNSNHQQQQSMTEFNFLTTQSMNKPSYSQITLKSFTDFNHTSNNKFLQQIPLTSTKSTTNINNNNNLNYNLHNNYNNNNNINNNQMSSTTTHRRSVSQMQNSSYDYQLHSKNKLYSQLFKKSNESKSLKKKQKIMPLLINDLAQYQQSSQQNDKNSPSQLPSPHAIPVNNNNNTIIHASPKINIRKRTDNNSIIIINNINNNNNNNNNNKQIENQKIKIFQQKQLSPTIKITNQQIINYKNKTTNNEDIKNLQQQNDHNLYQTSMNFMKSPRLNSNTARKTHAPFCSIQQFLDTNDNHNYNNHHLKFDIISNNNHNNNIKI